MELNQAKRSLKLKIAYYGAATCGKTTNLQVLYEQALGARKGDFISVNSQQDRTILCDLLPLRAGGFCGYDLRLQLIAVPGQSIYLVSRRAVLKGCDGVVFVANSAADRFHDNVQGYNELGTHLRAQQLDPAGIPLVFQYNKRDLPKVSDLEALNHGLNQRRVPAIPAVARRGEGVLETLNAILDRVLEDLCRRHPDRLPLPPDQPIPAWTKRALRSVFGRDSLAGVETQEDKAGNRPLKLQIPMPEEVGRAGAANDLRSAESLAESYAQASAELGLALNDVRQERDLAQARLSEVQLALKMAEAGAAPADLESRALRALEILAVAADASNASMYVTLGEVPEVLLLPPFVSDPLSRTPAGVTRLEAQRTAAQVELALAGEDADLARALATHEPPFQGVVFVPLRSAERLLGLALLYFWAHATLPSEDSLGHLGLLAKVLAGPLEATAAREAATAAREATTDARRLRTLSRASAMAMISVLTRLPPHALRRQPLSLEDLLSPLRAPGVEVQVDAGCPRIQGDAALLRFALTTLIHRCEAAALDRRETPQIRIRAGSSGYGVQVQVASGAPGGPAGAAAVRADFDADAEVSAVNAVLAQHSAFFVVPEGDVSATQFTLQFEATA